MFLIENKWLCFASDTLPLCTFNFEKMLLKGWGCQFYFEKCQKGSDLSIAECWNVNSVETGDGHVRQGGLGSDGWARVRECELTGEPWVFWWNWNVGKGIGATGKGQVVGKLALQTEGFAYICTCFFFKENVWKVKLQRETDFFHLMAQIIAASRAVPVPSEMFIWVSHMGAFAQALGIFLCCLLTQMY